MIRTSKLFVFAALALFPMACDAAGPKVGEMAKDFTLPSLGGKDVKLSDMTAKGPVVLVVLRGYPGYQCPVCARQFAELVKKQAEFAKAGAQMLFVYPGPSKELKDRAGEFVKGKDYPDNFQVLIDGDYSFTNAYGLRWNAEKETAYPATFVIDGAGKIVYAKVSKTHGDRAKADEVLAALPGK